MPVPVSGGAVACQAASGQLIINAAKGLLRRRRKPSSLLSMHTLE